jgi:hypothetical protein
LTAHGPPRRLAIAPSPGMLELPSQEQNGRSPIPRQGRDQSRPIARERQPGLQLDPGTRPNGSSGWEAVRREGRRRFSRPLDFIQLQARCRRRAITGPGMTAPRRARKDRKESRDRSESAPAGPGPSPERRDSVPRFDPETPARDSIQRSDESEIHPVDRSRPLLTDRAAPKSPSQSPGRISQPLPDRSTDHDSSPSP